MEHYKNQEQEFLDGVWAKARYLEYGKKEQQQIKKNQRQMAEARLKLATMLIVAVIMLSVPILLLGGLDIASMLGIGILTLGAGAYFEYFTEKQIYGRTTHGNKY